MRPRLLSLSVRWVACLIAIGAFAQSRVPSSTDLEKLSAEQAQAFLAGFRNSRLNGDLCLRFEIVHKPRQGDSLAPVEGTLWASTQNGAQLLRGEIKDAQGRLSLSFLTVKSADASHVWISRQGSPAIELDGIAPLVPLADGLILAPFDLQLPFTHWPTTTYAGTERRRRPVHVFDAVNLAGHEPTKVNFAVDSVYGVLLQATCFDADGKKSRTTQVEEFTKVDEQWMIATCSVRDEKSRDADLLRITEVSFGERFKPELFAPAKLEEPAAQPANFKKL